MRLPAVSVPVPGLLTGTISPLSILRAAGKFLPSTTKSLLRVSERSTSSRGEIRGRVRGGSLWRWSLLQLSAAVVRAAVLAVLFIWLPSFGLAQPEYRVYEDHPRLFLEPDRLKRMRKDVERRSVRWEQLRRLVDRNVALPEEPLVRALQFQTAGNEPAGRQAAAWAVAKAEHSKGFERLADLRLGAVVFDWCYELFTEEERARVAGTLGKAAGTFAGASGVDPGEVRSAALAAVAVAGDWAGSEPALADLLERRWKTEILPALRRGRLADRAEDLLAVIEFCHAVRNNLQRELWQDDINLFKSLPFALMLRYYPKPLQTETGVFRQPAMLTTVETDPEVEATVSRIAELSFVAYENSWEEYQFLQGWLRHDEYSLTNPLGAPYEFFWLNPYLPGLSYFSAPAVVHDEVRGRLFARAGWQEGDLWAGYFNSQLQIFADGQRFVVRREDEQAPLIFPEVVVVLARVPMSVKVRAPEARVIYMVGLGEGKSYNFVINKRTFRTYEAGRGGIIVLKNPPKGSGKRFLKFNKPIRIELTAAGERGPSLLGSKN